MNESMVKYIFLFLLSSSFLNFGIAIIARLKTKNKEFNSLVIYWPTVILTFITAGFLRNNPTEIAFAYFLHIFSSNMYANIMISSLKLKVNWKLHIGLQLATIAVSAYLLTNTNAGFTNSLLPLCVAFSLPFYAPIKYALYSHRKDSSWVEKSIAVVYITAIVHHFNMAFFRLDPNAEAWGWAITIAEYQCMSIFLPLMINYRRENNERSNLQHAVGKISGNIFIESRTEELYKQLEFQISQKEILNKELHNSNRHLKEEREMNEILIRTISHDLANPLTVINAYVDMLHSGKVSAEDTEKIWGRTKSNINSALHMIHRIRNAIVTRTQASLITNQDISLTRSIKMASEMFEENLRAKNIKLICNGPAADVLVRGEEKALVEHVLANLLSNAIKFSYEGSEIHLNTKDHLDKIQIEIRDFGTGIRVSGHGQPLMSSTTGTCGETGTGFGLMIMGYFLRQFGATIEIKSATEGTEKGTSANIFLQKSASPLLLNSTMPLFQAKEFQT